ncbi:transcriptional regulator, MarR family [Campylobacter iguaniorum]|uniref:Transcriptional regulator, MarR family n=1 Tax=Campylobacter iguaniorum TaxID=1244531 RepID=A0A076FB31_9BACT|nr:MarR family transcriptional regulator [Campylobacter iguaniorum]AII15450.1 transcriptional regulator, MarR family [Campylobacter iguaniorum]
MKYKGGFLISQIKQLNGRIVAQILAKNNITAFTGAQGRILSVLWKQDNMPIQEIAAKTGLAKTTMTNMLDNMEKLGLISRTFDAKDRRKVLIVLSDEAKALENEYEKMSKEMSDIFYAGFSEPEIKIFEQNLQRILKNLEEKIN